MMNRDGALMGGSWAMTYDLCLSSVLGYNDLEYRSRYNGFRVISSNKKTSFLRGGSWINIPNICCSDRRFAVSRLNVRDYFYGFRLVFSKPHILLRGGSWLGSPRDCRSASCYDNFIGRDVRNNRVGFRVVVSSLKPRPWLRGGGWAEDPDRCRSDARDDLISRDFCFDDGFRVVAVNESVPLRGGSWGYFPGGCRSAFRDYTDRRDSRSFDLGFRVISRADSFPLGGGSWIDRPEFCLSAIDENDDSTDDLDIGFRVVAEKKLRPGFARGGSLASYKFHCRSECHVSHKWFIGRGSVFGFRVVTQNENKKIKGGAYDSFRNVCRSEFVDLHIDKSLRDGSAGFRVVAANEKKTNLKGGSYFDNLSRRVYRSALQPLWFEANEFGFRITSTARIKPIKLKGGSFLTDTGFVGSDYTTFVTKIHKGERVDGLRIVCSS